MPSSIVFIKISCHGIYIAYKNYMKWLSKSYMSLKNNINIKGKKQNERDKRVPILW
jgi:hypothetical protein